MAVAERASSKPEQMRDQRQRVRAQADAGNAEANERMDRHAEQQRASRKRTAEAADGGDQHAQQRRAAELERITSRFAAHSAEARRERRQRVTDRAQTFTHEGGSVSQRVTAESQCAAECDRGRQRRE